MAVQTKYGMIYGSAAEVQLPFGKDRTSPFLDADNCPIQLIDNEADVVLAVRKYLAACEHDSRRSPLVVPKFVGIVQTAAIQEKDYDRTVSEATKVVQKEAAALLIGQGALDLADISQDDSFEPNLIHVCYDPASGMNRSLAFQSFGGRIHPRIVVSPLESLPQFYQKDPNSALGLVEMIAEVMKTETDHRKVTRAIQDSVDEVQKDMQKYGATSLEYGLYAPLKKMQDLAKSRL